VTNNIILFRLFPFIVGTSNVTEQPLQLKVSQSDLLFEGGINEPEDPSAVCTMKKCLNGKN
jgi:hypothetical protein